MENKKIILDELINRQYNSNYVDSKFIIFDIEYGGFGAMVARRKLALQFGLYFKRIVVFNYKGYAYEEPFMNISKFTINDIINENIVKFNYDFEQKDKVVFFDFNDYWNNVEIKKEFHEKSLNSINFIDFSGLLLNFLNLTTEYSDLLEKKIELINFNNEKTIGLHIRRGDKEVESPFIPVDIYVENAISIKEKLGINNIYICSDSNLAIKELTQKLNGFNIKYDSTEIRHDNKISNLSMVIGNNDLKKIETLNAIKNIYLLSDCDYIIGQSNVQFAKLAICKMVNKTNNLDNYTLIHPIDFKNVEWDV